MEDNQISKNINYIFILLNTITSMELGDSESYYLLMFSETSGSLLNQFEI